jgi:hypothetical protein
METKALVLYRNAYALYCIRQESEGIFNATLMRYDGHAENNPPGSILLTRSIRAWKGSTDLQYLVDELGEVIECSQQSGMFRNNKDNTIEDMA